MVVLKGGREEGKFKELNKKECVKEEVYDLGESGVRVKGK